MIIDLAERFEKIRIWKDGDRRAPHKPLLLLLALARLRRGRPRLASYGEVYEPQLGELLRSFGPPKKGAVNPANPYWRLRTDGLWEIPGADELPVNSDGVPPLRLLRATSGGFPPDIYAALRTDDAAVDRLAADLLEAHFPPSLWLEILDAVDMPPAAEAAPASATRASEAPAVYDVFRRLRRDAAFRHLVLEQYGHRCAMCGYDGRLHDGREHEVHLGIEAAHVKWHAANGPDEPRNGLALCVLHHRVFDRGALGVDEAHRIVVSPQVRGSAPIVGQWIRGLQGRPLRQPRDPSAQLGEEYRRWHVREVFRSANG